MRDIGRPNAEDPRCAYALLGGTDLGFGRIAGPGLGNMLLPWARAVVWTAQAGKPMVSPAWPQVKVGPWLRGETDKRSYWRDFLSRPGELTGIRKCREFAVATWIDEDGNVIKPGLPGAGSMKVFRGLRDFFHSLLGNEHSLRKAILEATRPRLRAKTHGSGGLGIHVRCGDFSRSSYTRGVPITGPVRLSAGWYASAVRDVLRVWPVPPSVRVFSDGSDSDLAEILAIPGVERAPVRAAITDILELAQCKVIVAAPNSTFSMWAKYLGGGIVISLPAADLEKCGLRYEVLDDESKSRCVKLDALLASS